jgi:CRP/FNR family transcriptional regulator, cyclic AMP receptor protein
MNVSLDTKRIFLIATEDPLRAENYRYLIQNTISNATIYLARDGVEALAKIENDPPHTLIVDISLPKVAGIKIMESVLNNKALSNMSFILVGDLPEEEIFLDDVVTGRLQFLTIADDKDDLSHCLARALNYWSHAVPQDFFLKFLAPNDLLLKQGDKADYVYIVRKGRLRASTTADSGDIELGQINAGEFVGEMSYITKSPRSADVVAETDCELIEIPINTFEKVLYQKPGWAKALMVTLSNRIKSANDIRKTES